MTYVLIGLAVLSGLTMIAALAWPAIRKYRRLMRLSAQPRYRKSSMFLTELEREMLTNLQDMVGPGLQVFPNVRLHDILELAGGSEDRNPGLAARLRSEAVDFLVCDRRTSMPMLVVEMHNPCADDEHTRGREELIAHLLEAAGLPLLPISRESPRSKLQLAECVHGSLSTYISKASQAA